MKGSKQKTDSNNRSLPRTRNAEDFNPPESFLSYNAMSLCENTVYLHCYSIGHCSSGEEKLIQLMLYYRKKLIINIITFSYIRVNVKLLSYLGLKMKGDQWSLINCIT